MGAEVDAIDISPAMLDLAKLQASERRVAIRTQAKGLLSFAYQPDSYDLVVSEFALHHLPDFWKAVAMSRIYRALKPGGSFFLRDIVFVSAPDGSDRDVEQWADFHIKNHDFSRDSVATHMRDEHSTFGWVIERHAEGCRLHAGLGRLSRADARQLSAAQAQIRRRGRARTRRDRCRLTGVCRVHHVAAASDRVHRIRRRDVLHAGAEQHHADVLGAELRLSPDPAARRRRHGRLRLHGGRLGLGLGAVFVAYPALQTVLKYAGTAYLVYLAATIAMSKPVTASEEDGRRPMTFWGAALFQWVNAKGWVMVVGTVTAYAAIARFPWNIAVLAGLSPGHGRRCRR